MTQRRRASNPTRQAILNAAELAFSANGFHATTVREIFAAARMNVGLMNYYFESKEALFQEVIARRISQVRQEFEQHFPRSSNPATPPACLDLLRFYLWFFLVHLPQIADGFREYWLVITRSSISYENAQVRQSLAEFDFVSQWMTAALRLALPGVPEQDIKGVLLFAESAVTTINATPGLPEHRLGARFVLPAYIERTALALTAGLASLSQQGGAAGEGAASA